MKGLMYKELFLSKKYRIITLSVYFIMLVMCILVKISSVCGNIANMEGKNMLLNTIFIVMGLALPAVLCGTCFTSQILNDEKCRFRQYSHTLPLTEKQIVGSLYIFNLIMFGIYLLAGWLNYFLACAVFDRNVDLKYLLYIFIIGIMSFTAFCFNSSNSYRFRSAKICTAIIVSVCIIAYLGIGFGFICLMNHYFKKRGYDMFSDDSDKEVPDALMVDFGEDFSKCLRWTGTHFWWLIVLAVAALVFFSFRRSVRALERRGN